MNMKCRVCDVPIKKGRWDLGYRLCLEHGDEVAHEKKFTVVPMHKSNYVACFNRDDLKGINNKGGLIK